MPPHRSTSQEARVLAARRRAARRIVETTKGWPAQTARPLLVIAVGLALEADPHMPRNAADVASEDS